MDATQMLKQQIGELVWNNAILTTELERVNKELEDTKKKKNK